MARALRIKYEGAFYHVTSRRNERKNELIKRKGDGRALIIHLLKNKTGITNRQIGDLVGGLTYSGLSRIEQKVCRKIKEKQKIEQRSKNRASQYVKCQGLTAFLSFLH